MTSPPAPGHRGAARPDLDRPDLDRLVTVPLRATSLPAAEVAGVDLEGRPRALHLTAPGRWTLLLFLGSRCDGCLPFWTAIEQPASLGLEPGDTAVSVTHDPGREDADAVRALLAGTGAAAHVVMSSSAWRAYGVQGPPFFSVTDGETVVSEGVAWSVEQLARDVGRARRALRGGDAQREE